jgi:hypothetical protein
MSLRLLYLVFLQLLKLLQLLGRSSASKNIELLVSCGAIEAADGQCVFIRAKGHPPDEVGVAGQGGARDR